MRKHDEGYVLAYVMVILAVLMLIALSVMSVSLTGLQRQQADIQRMQDKYAAEGAIERAMETINAINTSERLEPITNMLEEISFEGAEVDVLDADISDDDEICVIKLTAKRNSMLITCELEIKCDSITDSYGNEALQNPKVQKILSYKISAVEQTEGGGEDVPQ